ncbi:MULTISPECIES: type I-E CRISPR-associated protein Cse1/CasA [Arthrobacter]|uniref:Type I-E CRISPR-associated protein Cse1/CasA n=2 Tax=Arthrobacter TaxID=1663 RepID=A0ABU9KLQ5_9MICC|nr:type I-E CRISPR-associated protein Cse1/CasA [Arthrobacter sp. YJM1]MDP5227050.1 type I-E CRISPR-associated protein Cse1/CasA [Arthrobacter sp. YJM1]
MEENPQFNLVHDPWVSCLMIDGTIQTLSLNDFFLRSSSIRRLAGELPTQDYAVLRLLLAIAYRSAPDVDAADVSEVWGVLWRDQSQLTRMVLEYLEESREDFELFDAVRPFMQVAGLHTSSGKVDGVRRLIADVPSGHQYFTTRAGSGLDSLSFAEAARWLIHTHAYDPSGIKSGAVGDPRVKGGKGYPIGTGWTGATGGIFFEGASMSETIHLNLHLPSIAADVDGIDVPVWERDPLGAAEEQRVGGQPRPTGPVDVFTWPSRRVRLFPEKGRVRSVIVSNGDPLAIQNMDLDPMTAQRFSKPQTAKFRKAVYMPREHDPERTLWSGVGSLLIQTEKEASTDGEPVPIKVAPMILWVARLGELGAIDSSRLFNVRLIGAEYGTQSSVISEILDDGLAFHLSLLSDRSVTIRNVVRVAAAETEAAVWAFGRFAGELSRAAGGEPESQREKARQSVFFALNEPFRRWVSDLLGDEPGDVAAEWWNAEARRILKEYATELLAVAGELALIGRSVGGEFISAATAETWLNRSLRKHLPLKHEIEERERLRAVADLKMHRPEGAKR